MDTMLFYLFSAIAQTYGAILGVMGMLAVYRLQMLRGVRRDLRAKYVQEYPEYSADNVTNIIRKVCEKHQGGRPSNPDLRRLYDHSMGYCQLLKDNLDTTKEIRDSFYVFLGVHLSMIILALIALILVDSLKSVQWQVIFFFVFPILCVSAIQIVGFSISILSGE
jgi:hypothetical protein